MGLQRSPLSILIDGSGVYSSRKTPFTELTCHGMFSFLFILPSRSERSVESLDGIFTVKQYKELHMFVRTIIK